MPRRVLNVFLSSTAVDLVSFREEIYQRLVSKGLFHCERQENFGAQNAEAVKFCRTKVEEADLFVGLVGLRRGWEPDGDDARRSITEMEHDWAREKGVSRYIWVAPDDFLVPGNIRENDELHGRQQAFRKSVMANGERIVSQKGFDSPALLAADVVEQLLVEIVTSDLIREIRPDLRNHDGTTVEGQKPAIAAAVERLAEDQDVDLLALAKNPEDADLAELEARLRARAEKLGAESAEYWRHIGALAFLHDTRRALAAYEKAVTFDPGYPEGWRYLGELQFRLGDLAAAENSFATLRDFPDDRSQSLGCMRLGWIYRVRGDLPAAEEMTTRSSALSRTCAMDRGAGRSL